MTKPCVPQTIERLAQITLTAGEIGRLANGAVWAEMGETVSRGECLAGRRLCLPQDQQLQQYAHYLLCMQHEPLQATNYNRRHIPPQRPLPSQQHCSSCPWAMCCWWQSLHGISNIVCTLCGYRVPAQRHYHRDLHTLRCGDAQVYRRILMIA